MKNEKRQIKIKNDPAAAGYRNFSFFIFHFSFRRGFTALEIVIVVSILSLLGSLSLVSFLNARRVQDLVTAGNDLVVVLRLAQQKAASGEGGSAWGVRLEQGQYVMFQGTSYAVAATTTVYALPPRVEIADIALWGGGQEVIFSGVEGATLQQGTLVVRVRESAAQAFAITVDSSGRAYQTGTAQAPAGTRVVDARHRTYTFSWGIGDATDLIFTFSNPADVRTVVMAPAAPRAAYDSGELTFTVGGEVQVMRVHALTLLPGSTALSVDRDCRRNTKKAAIAIRGGDGVVRDITTYEADCRTITVGAHGGVMSEP